MKKLITLLLLLSFAVSSSAQKNSINEKIFKIIEDNSGLCNKLYIDLHKNPELSFMSLIHQKKWLLS